MLINSTYHIHDFFNARSPMDIDEETYEDVKKDYYWITPRVHIFKRTNKLEPWESLTHFHILHQAYAD